MWLAANCTCATLIVQDVGSIAQTIVLLLPGGQKEGGNTEYTSSAHSNDYGIYLIAMLHSHTFQRKETFHPTLITGTNTKQ